MRHDVVVLLRELVQTPSENPPGGEQAVAERLAAFLADGGIPAELRPVAPGRPNLVASLQGAAPGPTVWLNAHLDTVPAGDRASWSADPFAAVVRDGRVIGRGSSDDKGGVAAMAVALATLAQDGGIARGRVIFTAVMGEETGNVGTTRLLDDGLRADCAVVGEWSGAGRIATGYRGNLWLRVAAAGRAAHGSRPGDGINAIDRMTSEVLPRLRALPLDHQPAEGFLDPHPSLSVNQIHGGIKVNVVPDACEATVDVRLVPGQEPDAVLAAFQGAVADLGYPVRLEVLAKARPFVTPREGDLVRAFAAAIRAVTGAEPGFLGKTGTSDANVISGRLRIPVIAYGPGNRSGHGPDEHLEIDDLRTATAVLHRALVGLCGGRERTDW